jgi:hypothetical protein
VPRMRPASAPLPQVNINFGLNVNINLVVFGIYIFNNIRLKL